MSVQGMMLTIIKARSAMRESGHGDTDSAPEDADENEFMDKEEDEEIISVASTEEAEEPEVVCARSAFLGSSAYQANAIDACSDSDTEDQNDEVVSISSGEQDLEIVVIFDWDIDFSPSDAPT